MRKIKEFSLAVVIIPFLTSGCVQEKVSSIRPSKKQHISSSKTINLKKDNKLNPILILSDKDKNTTDSKLFSLIPNAKIISTEDAQIVPISDIIVSNVINNDDIKEIDETSSNDDNWVEMSKEDEIVETAKEFLGIKYVWAANGPDCFDCSGFTKYVYKLNGITLPRYSGHQAQVGTKVNFDELQKGDLVFFDTEKKFKGRVTHVGIYIGDGKFIHASSAKKQVTITSFNKKPFYKRRFLRGERIIDSQSTFASL
jgi:cell wall-associated NlpC family hydrolase